jgi:hypothetical protein
MSTSRALELRVSRVADAPWLKDLPKPPGYDDNYSTVSKRMSERAREWGRSGPCSLTHSLTHSLFYCLLNHTFPARTHSHTTTHILLHSRIYYMHLTHARTHSRTHSHTHSPTHSLTAGHGRVGRGHKRRQGDRGQAATSDGAGLRARQGHPVHGLHAVDEWLQHTGERVRE